MKKKYIYKNQQLLLESNAKISINERGFLFGDGIFESAKIYNSKIYDFSNHLKRLKLGLSNLKITADISDIEEKSYKLIKKNLIQNGTLRISISRGIGSNGYLPKEKIKPLIIIQTKPASQKPKNFKLGISSYKIPKTNFGKTSNSLIYVLSKIESQKNNVFDSVMLSEEGDFIAECASANIFWVKNNKIYTPSKSLGIVKGTKREKIIKLSPLKIEEKLAKLSELKKADEIFLTNANLLLQPISSFNNKVLKKDIGLKLKKIFEEDLKKSCKKN